MVRLGDRLEPNESEVAAKIIDDEAILINLSNGTFYTMDRVGAFIWSLIEGGYTLAKIIEALTNCYDVSAEQAQADVERIAAELVQEELVKRTGQKGTATSGPNPSTEKLPYEPPKLHTYRDMGDLLALDPPMPGLTEIPWEGSKEGSSDTDR